MLRISLIDGGKRPAVLRLEGRVAGPWVTELQQACEKLLREGRPLRLELSEVLYLDSDGVCLISKLRGRGIDVTGCSPFIEEQLRAA